MSDEMIVLFNTTEYDSNRKNTAFNCNYYRFNLFMITVMKMGVIAMTIMTLSRKCFNINYLSNKV